MSWKGVFRTLKTKCLDIHNALFKYPLILNYFETLV